MLYFPQEDDHKADENDGGEENGASPNAGIGAESNELPVVKGVCVDYVHANRDGASVFGRQKWRESGR